jgi:ketosteroid isomerase-like protein
MEFMTPARMEKVESAIRLALAFREAFNQHNIQAMMVLFKDDCHFESPNPAPNGLTINGKDELFKYWHHFFETTSQSKLDIEEIFGFGERCIIRWNLAWTDTHDNHLTLRGVYIFKTENSLICELFSYIKGTDFSQ